MDFGGHKGTLQFSEVSSWDIPLKLLKPRYNSLSIVKFPISAGMVPVRDNTSLAQSSAHSNSLRAHICSKEEACSKEDAMRPDQLNDSPYHYSGFASCETTDKRADQAHSTLKQRSKIRFVKKSIGQR